MGSETVRRDLLSVDAIRQTTWLAERGLPKGEIARIVGITWKSVDRIVRGIHAGRENAARYRRCPGCGGLVLMPCLACSLRARRRRHAI